MRIQLRQVEHEPFTALTSAGIDPVLARIYSARGVAGPDDLDLGLAGLASYTQLKDIDRAAKRLATAIKNKENVAISGDYDSDGAAGSSLLIEGILDLGGKLPSLFIPNRLTQGYGLSPGLVAEMPADTNLVITVDNGIASIAGVAAARARGFDVIITDHHLAGERLPEDCVAIVNPNQPGCAFPWKGTAGVGVAFYLIAATRAKLRADGWLGDHRPEPNLSKYLDLVALATIADVAPFERNNRIFIAAGLERIRQRRCRIGILALLEVAGVEPENVTAETVGFIVAPRINAAGRLEDMRTGVRLLLSQDEQAAREIARTLDQLNRERRSIEDGIREEAEEIAAQIVSAPQDGEPFVLCPYQPDWHEGVIGIVAARLRERFHRPTIVFTKAADGSIKGSGRSIPWFHIRDAIAAVDAQHPGLITRFGGHAAAAGLSLAKEADIAVFTEAFAAVARRELRASDLEETIYSDGELGESTACLDTALAIEKGGPWGRGFEPPIFHGTFLVRNVRELRSNTLKCTVQKENWALDAIWFRRNSEQSLEEGKRYTMVYALSVNRWRSRENLQLRIEKVLEEHS